MCVFEKQLIYLLNIWSLFIFQQLTLTAAATYMIVAAVLIVSSIRIFLICAFTIFLFHLSFFGAVAQRGPGPPHS